MTEQPLTQAQDHDRRIGRFEGIAEQSVEQGRQTNARFDRIEQAIAAQGRKLRQEIAAQGRRIDALTRWLVGVGYADLVALALIHSVRKEPQKLKTARRKRQ